MCKWCGVGIRAVRMYSLACVCCSVCVFTCGVCVFTCGMCAVWVCDAYSVWCVYSENLR